MPMKSAEKDLILKAKGCLGNASGSAKTRFATGKSIWKGAWDIQEERSRELTGGGALDLEKQNGNAMMALLNLKATAHAGHQKHGSRWPVNHVKADAAKKPANAALILLV